MDTSRPDLRASDAEREGVAEQLRDHCAAGRLTMAELDERLAVAYAARTHGELLALLSDLPQLQYPLPLHEARPVRPAPALPAPHRPPSLTPRLANLLAVSLLLLMIWGLTALPDAFWPKWPIGITAAVAAGGFLRERAGGHRDRTHGEGSDRHDA